jgi:hypothetical protein
MAKIKKHIYYALFFFGLAIFAFGVSFYIASDETVDGSRKESVRTAVQDFFGEGVKDGIKENPRFIDEKDIVPECILSKSTDDIFRPLLNDVFGSARLKNPGVCGNGKLKNMEYALEILFKPEIGTALYNKMIEKGFKASSPRYSAARKIVEIEMDEKISGSTRLVALKLDIENQSAIIEVN